MTVAIETLGPVNPGNRGNQVLVRAGSDYYVVSGIASPWTGERDLDAIVSLSGAFLGTSTEGPETLVFPADSDGNIVDWGEVAGGPGMTREQAIDNLRLVLS